MSKIDLYKLHKADYATPSKPTFIDIKPAQYLAIRGSGTPGGPEFQAAIGALYKAAFTVKMASKRAGRDYAVCKLEGLYSSFEEWTLMIRTPDFINEGMGDVKLKKLDEGRCVQVLHAGSFDKEGPVIAAMAAFAKENGMRARGEHHEIYLSDPRKVAPEKFRTILRQPVHA
jgi:hypothetical protein